MESFETLKAEIEELKKQIGGSKEGASDKSEDRPVPDEIKDKYRKLLADEKS